jgi:hypothetical protein
MVARYFLGPLTLPAYGRKLHRMVNNLLPDLVHALRIPFEGMLARYIPPEIPLAVSIWGNDLTLHTSGSGWMRRLTQRVIERANGLAADTKRDIRLGRILGFREDGPALVVPGSGGIERDRAHPLQPL